MEYNNPSLLIKDLNFGQDAKSKIGAGVEKLAKAVKSTLGASGQCVIYEDARGVPVITKDGVTVAESVVLYDPVENMGATLIKEAAKNTVKEAGDGTTTATVLAESILNHVNSADPDNNSLRDIKNGVNSGLEKVNNYLDSVKIDVNDDMLTNVAAISCNNDTELGSIIAEAYQKVGKDGVVLMEESETEETYVEVVDGVQLSDCGLTSPHFITNQDKQKCELESPLVLICMSEIPNIRKIQTILEYVIKHNRSLLIVAPVSQQVKSALLMNKVKGNIKINIIDLPGFGAMKKDNCEDLAVLTGAKVMNEELGDDLDLIDVDCLGEVEYAVTDDKSTVLTTLEDLNEEVGERINQLNKMIADEKNGFFKKKLEQRLSMLSGSVGIIKVGANSKVELKEKKDRVEDAIYATKAALKEGIVPGGGIALLNASQKISTDSVGEGMLLKAIQAPFNTIMHNAGFQVIEHPEKEGVGVNVVTGKEVNMVDAGIIDPVLVTKSALKNAVSVVMTIVSADCVISNARANESN
jgi:chaperonin GroEL